MRGIICSIAILLCSVARTQELKPVYVFGVAPHGPVPFLGVNRFVQDDDGTLYSSAISGGEHFNGCVFRVTKGGDMAILHSFRWHVDGRQPMGGVSLGSDGDIYGTCVEGGPANQGTVWKVSPAGNFTLLHAFTGPDGGGPACPPVEGNDGNFYGVTQLTDGKFAGVLYRVSPTGDFTVLHHFEAGSSPEGWSPIVLRPTGDGTFYGLTQMGMAIFKASPDGAVKVVQRPPSSDKNERWDVLLASDGNYYEVSQEGFICETTPDGGFKILHSLNRPWGELLEGKDGFLYGRAFDGTFRIRLSGTDFQMVHKLQPGQIGNGDSSLIAWGKDGLLYSMAPGGMIGTIYSTDISKVAYPSKE